MKNPIEICKGLSEYPYVIISPLFTSGEGYHTCKAAQIALKGHPYHHAFTKCLCPRGYMYGLIPPSHISVDCNTLKYLIEKETGYEEETD